MVVLKLLREFAGGTSIHGFGFLVSPKTSPRTKIIWAILLVVALFYASMVSRVYIYDALSPLLGAASARLGSSSLEQQDATIG